MTGCLLSIQLTHKENIMTKNNSHSKPNTFSHLNNKDKKSALKKQWTTMAEQYLLGRTIIGLRYLTDEECNGWDNASVVIHLDDGSFFYPVKDDEGNDAGAIFHQKGDQEAGLPVISSY